MTKLICILLMLFPMNAQAQEVVLAVSYFDNHAKDVKYEALRKGLAEMLISDLSTSKDLKVVERERLNDVLNEISLQQSKFFDQKLAFHKTIII